MPLRPPAGFRSAFYDPLKVADAPTAPAASGGDAQASVTFTAPSNVGGAAITQYYAVSDPSQITGNAASSPVTVTGLTNGTAYTFRVWALNSYGPSPYSAATGSVTPAAPRGVFAGGSSNIIDYITIGTLGNATDFGDLTLSAGYATGTSNSSRGVFSGFATNSNVIEYITISSTGNSQDFGDLTVARDRVGGASNSTRGLCAGGFTGADDSNVIDYITISTIGNATDFGDLTRTAYGIGALSNGHGGL